MYPSIPFLKPGRFQTGQLHRAEGNVGRCPVSRRVRHEQLGLPQITLSRNLRDAPRSQLAFSHGQGWPAAPS